MICHRSTYTSRKWHEWAAPCENVSSDICWQRRPRSACASAQSDHGLHCPLTESLDTTECMYGEQRPRWYLLHVQDDLNLHFAHVWRHFFAWCGPCEMRKVIICQYRKVKVLICLCILALLSGYCLSISITGCTYSVSGQDRPWSGPSCSKYR